MVVTQPQQAILRAARLPCAPATVMDLEQAVLLHYLVETVAVAAQ
jgi:hypothetical protein